jgi:hypothetical protein
MKQRRSLPLRGEAFRTLEEADNDHGLHGFHGLLSQRRLQIREIREIRGQNFPVLR